MESTYPALFAPVTVFSTKEEETVLLWRLFGCVVTMVTGGDYQGRSTNDVLFLARLISWRHLKKGQREAGMLTLVPDFIGLPKSQLRE